MKYLFLYFILIFSFVSCQDTQIVKKPKKDNSVVTVYDTGKKNTYTAVKLGNQYWFQQNLRTEVYTVLKNVKGRNYTDTINHYRPYNFDLAYFTKTPIDTLAVQFPYKGYDSLVKKYGRMYTWYAAVDGRNICPSGWHVPSETEWDNMIQAFGSDSLTGGKLKDTSNVEWEFPNLTEYNVFKFNAQATGYRTEFGSYVDAGKFAFFWSSTSDPDDPDYAIAYGLYAHSKQVYKRKMSKRVATSIRCVR
jgi:uncharacterized protein (TIGR02145 family)